MTLLCVAAGCPTEVRKIGLRLDWSCPHRIRVRWHPQARQLVAVVTNVHAPACERTVRVEAGRTAVAELAARLSGLAWLGWWARLPLFWRMWRAVDPAASPMEIWALWRTAERRRSFVRRDAEWAAWVRSGPPWSEGRSRGE